MKKGFLSKSSIIRAIVGLAIASPLFIYIGFMARYLVVPLLPLTFFLSLFWTYLFGGKFRSVYALSIILLPHVIYWFLVGLFMGTTVSPSNAIAGGGFSFILLLSVWRIWIAEIVVLLAIEYFAYRRAWW